MGLRRLSRRVHWFYSSLFRGERRFGEIVMEPDDYVFKWGKHEGETFQEVLEDDPNYLSWVYENCQFIDSDLENLLEEYAR